MRIRRATYGMDLRTAPIDKLDAFLLALLEETMPLGELAEIAPCDDEVTALRVHRMVEIGLIEVPDLPAPQRLFKPSRPPAFDTFDEAVTLRPPAPLSRERQDSDAVVTLRPPPSDLAPLVLDLGEFGDPPKTGIRARPIAPAQQAIAKVKILQRKP